MRWVPWLALLAFAVIGGVVWMAFLYAPVAQCASGCLTQKIFYIHVPSAYAMYIGVGACVIGSIGYLAQRTRGWDALAQAGAELVVLFAVVVLITGPLWGRKAWGHYWVWDPRLTTTLLATLIFVAYLVVHSPGSGEPERRFAAALAIMGAAVVPIIHYSVRLWRGQHPMVITGNGGGLHHPAMTATLGMGFIGFSLLAAALLLLRTHMGMLEARVEGVAMDRAARGEGR